LVTRFWQGACLSQAYFSKDDLMTAESIKVLRYWRNSLADMDKLGLSAQEMRKTGISASFDSIKKGRLIQQRIEPFFIEAEKQILNKIRRKKQFQRNVQPEDEKPLPPLQRLPVIIAPYKAVKIFEHGRKIAEYKPVPEVLPLWLVADLKRSGELEPSENPVYPWIERRCLTPNETTPGYPMIGDVTQSDEFYTRKADFFAQHAGKPSWQKLFELTEALLEHIPEKEIKILLKEQYYDLQNIGYVRPWSDTHGMSKAIIDTYDQYLFDFDHQQKLPVLLQKFCHLDPQQRQSGLSVSHTITAAKRHLAQPQGKFPLSISQRTSLNDFFDEEEHPLVTIHGPPGTGKTSLLLSMMASLWVERALQKRAPPILVATSTNNLATNILENFQSECRWLPECYHYCLYLTPDYKKDDAIKNHYLYRLKIKNESIEGVETMYLSEYHQKATQLFLENFNDSFQETATDLNYCQNYIHQKMLKTQATLHRAIDLFHDLSQIQQQIAECYADYVELELDILKHQTEKTHLQSSFQKWTDVRRDWQVCKEKLPGWLKLLRWFGIGKKFLCERIRYYTSQYSDLFIDLPEDIPTVDRILDKHIRDLDQAKQQVLQTLTDLEWLQARYRKNHEDKIVLQSQLGFELTDTQCLPDQLDVHLRHELFLLATHYWEAAWLRESLKIAACGYDIQGRQKYWEIQAMLTPCFVTTLHSGPRFFDYKPRGQEFKTLSDFIDLLIIDEAGQALPAMAGAMVGIAKRALFVGDVKQIEPMAPLSEGIDFANAKKFGVCVDEAGYKHLKSAGILCASNISTGQAYGNVIALGQRHAPGVQLTEHRRCAKEIISYCNELCYDNQLVIMTPEKPSLYPRMGYAHIKGLEKKHGGSRYNPLEAEVIARWIEDNTDNICANCGSESLDDCIGIITPFAAQVGAIRDKLNHYKLRIEKVGTVHSLQGAEKPIIIFSSVYAAKEHPEQFFFDRSPNMLNVAVSRAKMSFLVFGDMDIFDPRQLHRPSGLLAKYLFNNESNEISNIRQPMLWRVDAREIQHIVTLEQHRYELKAAFENSTEKLSIVSPFLRRRAIECDQIPDMIRRCRALGVTINIYTDPMLNQGHRSEFKEVMTTLKDAGATMILVNNVHSKIIAIDNLVIIEGSFNWLSAPREGPYVRQECSLRYQGEKTADFISEALEPIRKKASFSLQSKRENSRAINFSIN
jgi:AAA domain